MDTGECAGDVLAELCADSEVPSPEDWTGFESFARRLLRIWMYLCQLSNRCGEYRMVVAIFGGKLTLSASESVSDILPRGQTALQC